MVIDAYLGRHGPLLVYDPILSVTPTTAAQFWERSSLERRRAILTAAITRLVLVPRPPNNRRGMGLPRGRDLSIEWAALPEPRTAWTLTEDAGDKQASMVCEMCGRRKYVSNFRRDPTTNKRASTCSRCRSQAQDAPVVIRGRRPKTSWSEWRRKRILFPPEAFIGK